MTKTKDTIERLVDGQMWVEELLNLFFAVDEVFKSHADERNMDPRIRKAYLRAEAARQELA